MNAGATQTHCLAAEEATADEIYRRVCRTDFTEPGFCLIDLGENTSSTQLRQCMVELQQQMQAIERERTARELVFVSAARFDQQESTKLHRDGGPEESLLILGYEPTEITAEVQLADYARCAYELGLTPAQFLRQHNPMFAAGEALLRPYTTKVTCFEPSHSQILVINNSAAEYQPAAHKWQGVLHTARILGPDASQRRVINSTMVVTGPLGSVTGLATETLAEFITTAVVHRRGYDKPHLAEDGASTDSQ